MIEARNVTAVIVTRGDHERELKLIRASLFSFREVIVWDNSKREDARVFGRFLGASLAATDTVYVQDDDALVDAEDLVRKHDVGKVTVNMPLDRRDEYAGTGISLIGWGAVFEKERADVFARYLSTYERDELFERECDRVFTFLNRNLVRQVEVKHSQFLFAHGNDRMGREARHREDFLEIQQRARRL